MNNQSPEAAQVRRARAKWAAMCRHRPSLDHPDVLQARRDLDVAEAGVLLAEASRLLTPDGAR